MSGSWLGLCCEQLGWEPLLSFSGSAVAQWKQCSALSSLSLSQPSSALVRRVPLLGAFSNSGNSHLVPAEGQGQKVPSKGDKDEGWEWTCARLWGHSWLGCWREFQGLMFPPDGGPGVPGLMGVVVCVLQLTAGTGRTVNQLSTMDTPWLPKSSSKMWLKLSTNMPLSRMSMYPACQPLSLRECSLASLYREWRSDLFLQRTEFQTEFGVVFWGKVLQILQKETARQSWVGTFCPEAWGWLYWACTTPEEQQVLPVNVFSEGLTVEPLYLSGCALWCCQGYTWVLQG